MTCTIISDGSEILQNSQNEREQPYIKIKKQLREAVGELLFEGYDTFYVNCEYGVPLWAAEIICALKLYNSITLNIIMPYENQAANWCEEHRERFFKLHAKADSVVMLDTQYYSDIYEIADEIMIDKSDLLAAFGRNSDETYAADYARKNKITVKYFR